MKLRGKGSEGKGGRFRRGKAQTSSDLQRCGWRRGEDGIARIPRVSSCTRMVIRLREPGSMKVKKVEEEEEEKGKGGKS